EEKTSPNRVVESDEPDLLVCHDHEFPRLLDSTVVFPHPPKLVSIAARQSLDRRLIPYGPLIRLRSQNEATARQVGEGGRMRIVLVGGEGVHGERIPVVTHHFSNRMEDGALTVTTLTPMNRKHMV